MQEYLRRGDLPALEEYLCRYGASLPDDSLVRFCENVAANAVLLYFAQQAKDAGIDYIFKADTPQDSGLSETDISVLLGNLLENALDACRGETGEDRRIIVRAGTDGGSLCITVDNTYHGTLRHTADGRLTSTKHRGAGLGTQSVRSIAGRRAEKTSGQPPPSRGRLPFLCPIPGRGWCFMTGSSVLSDQDCGFGHSFGVTVY